MDLLAELSRKKRLALAVLIFFGSTVVGTWDSSIKDPVYLVARFAPWVAALLLALHGLVVPKAATTHIDDFLARLDRIAAPKPPTPLTPAQQQARDVARAAEVRLAQAEAAKKEKLDAYIAGRRRQDAAAAEAAEMEAAYQRTKAAPASTRSTR